MNFVLYNTVNCIQEYNFVYILYNKTLNLSIVLSVLTYKNLPGDREIFAFEVPALVEAVNLH